jgi:HNH endonuclease
MKSRDQGLGGTQRMETETLAAKFFRYVVKTQQCWNWVGSKNKAGYGRLWFSGEYVLAHRLSYELLRGEIPERLELDHLCRNPGCVNPDHLEAVTHAENNLRGISPPAHNARATHCIRGHRFDADNTRYLAGGRRRCKTCDRIQHREAWRAKNPTRPKRPWMLKETIKTLDSEIEKRRWQLIREEHDKLAAAPRG